MKTKNLFLSIFLLLSFGCTNNGDLSKDDNSTKEEQESDTSGYKIIQVLDNETVIIRKHLLTQEEMDYQEIPDSFAFELQPQRYVGTGISEFVIPSIHIPDEYRMEGISVTISGNITDRLAGHSEPNARFRPYNRIELKSINYLSVLTDLPWLKAKVDEITLLFQDKPVHIAIYQCTYGGGKTGFLEDRKNIAYLYNCEGETLCIMGGDAGETCSEFDIDFENKTLIHEINKRN